MSAIGVLHTVFSLMKLIFILPGMTMNYYLKRRGAVNRFRRELIAGGVPPDEARELAKMYPFKLREAMKAARGFSEN